MSTIENAVAALMPEAIETLAGLCRIPSVSFPDYDPAQVSRSAEAVAELFRKNGFPEVKIATDCGAPAVLAAWGNDPTKKTVLLYAHHDVQPEMRITLWQSPPYEPTIRGGRIFARGAADDKAGILVHAMAVATLKRMNESCANIRVIIEGEEEVGSPSLGKLLSTYREFLRSDVAIVADLGNFATGIPALTSSLRGMVALEVEARALERAVHSGIWSGPVPDVVQALCKTLASLTDASGRIAVPGLLESVIPPDAETLFSYASLGYKAESYRKEAGMVPTAQLMVPENKIPESLWRQPSITITTVEAGNRRTAGNVLLDSAWARVSIRLVPGMHWKTVVEQVSKHLRANCPWGVQLDIRPDEGADAWICPVDSPAFRTMHASLSEGYAQNTRIMGCGASIPGAPLFREIFGDIPVLLTGLEDQHANAHGENESLDLEDFRKAILSEALFLNRVV
jgi:acetylornithine deacetylase/succinyl-diaminopimelate desuccinylase-like protein